MKFAYKTLRFKVSDHKTTDEELNIAGQEGWRLINSFPVFSDLASEPEIIFILIKDMTDES